MDLLPEGAVPPIVPDIGYARRTASFNDVVSFLVGAAMVLGLLIGLPLERRRQRRRKKYYV